MNFHILDQSYAFCLLTQRLGNYDWCILGVSGRNTKTGLEFIEQSRRTRQATSISTTNPLSVKLLTQHSFKIYIFFLGKGFSW